MTHGFGKALFEVRYCRKSGIINNELKRLNINIALLQKTILADEGQIMESDYTFFWQGKPAEEQRMHGVGFAVRNTLLLYIVEPTGASVARSVYCGFFSIHQVALPIYYVLTPPLI